MLNEDALIPFHSSDPTGKRVLVLAPHPDDETIGCGGTLVLHALAGDPVRVIFLTNGAKGDISGRFDRETYIRIRQQEARSACACLGITDIEFWPNEDRCLAGMPGVLKRLTDVVNDYCPALIYAPSPLEFHPDHRAVAVLVRDLSQTIQPDCQVMLYEVNQPFCINTLVNITPVLALKKQAIEIYVSQLDERPYDDVTLALNRFRSLTLTECTHAEGFFQSSLSQIRQIGLYNLPFWQLDRHRTDASASGPLVSIIIRTKDRPSLLAEAIQSVVRQTYANLELVVVNDGGQDVRNIIDAASGNLPVVLVTHEYGRGRAAAANSGLNAANGAWFNFLDDDDLLYPDHVTTLVNHLQTHGAEVAYTSVRNAYYDHVAPSGAKPVREEVIFNLDFDPDLLLFENYIPIMSVMFSRNALKGMTDMFCESLILFEDWDFWVRLSRNHLFHHIDRVTAEYRFFGSSGIESAHRSKYAYDESKAIIFDRVKSFMTGNSWTRFLQNGSVGQLQQQLKNIQMVVDDHREELTQLKQNIQTWEICQADNRKVETLADENEWLRSELKREHALSQTLATVLSRNDDIKITPLRDAVTRVIGHLASWNRIVCRTISNIVRFDSRFYLLKHPDVSASGKHPFIHFLTHGIREKRETHSDHNR